MAISRYGVPMNLAFTTFASPLGEFRLFATDNGLAAILWERDDPNRCPLAASARDDGHPLLRRAKEELQEYFAGRRMEFSIPLDVGGSGFQKRVWQALCRIPFGETRSYLDIARQLGCPGAVRAVGAANGRNPVSIVVPCHRVIGSNGRLTGFAGGLAAKEYLLALERRGAPRTQLALFG